MKPIFSDEERSLALEQSIERWARLSLTTDVDTIEMGAMYCPLCKLYNDDGYGGLYNGCKGCPVKERTGYSYCLKSPYGIAHQAFTELGSNPTEEALTQFRTCCRNKYEFLCSLRKTGDNQ